MFSHPEKNITQAYVGEGMVVADFGSGSGHHAIAAARAVGKYGKVYAIDVQIDLLHKIKKDAERQGLDNVDILHADLEQERGSGLADHSVDRVFIFNTLFFSEVRSTIVGEAFRILRSKGRLAIIEILEPHLNKNLIN